MFVDPFGLEENYIFYDPSFLGEGKTYAEADKNAFKTFSLFGGSNWHLIDIWSKDGFQWNWNNRLGSDGDGKIGTVIIISHSYYYALSLGESGRDDDLELDDFANPNLTRKDIDILVLAVCSAGETAKDSNLEPRL